MVVKDFLEKYKEDFFILAGEKGLDKEIENIYIGDLLSWVMGKAPENCAWITIQGHINIVAVALLVEASCIIVAEGAEVSEESVAKASEENIPLIKTKLTHYEIAKIFCNEGI